jgi:ankyrin repeat protein
MLQRARDTNYIDVNCVDPLGRSGLLMAIDNENLEMVELLIEYRVETKDALLHAISEEYVEAVEVLLDHEESFHKEGEPHVRRITNFNFFILYVSINSMSRVTSDKLIVCCNCSFCIEIMLT